MYESIRNRCHTGVNTETQSRIQVFGADWCGPTSRARRHLDNLGVDYDYINVDQNSEASRWVKSQNNGKEKKPTIRIDDVVLTYPSDQEVEEVLRTKGLL